MQALNDSMVLFCTAGFTTGMLVSVTADLFGALFRIVFSVSDSVVPRNG